MNPAEPDPRGGVFYEVRYEGNVAGPVTWDQIRRGRAAGKIPAGAQARNVGGWQPVDEAVQRSDSLSASGALPDHVPLEVRAAGQVVGPVTLDQVRRGHGLGKIPEDAELRRVGPWRPVAHVLKTDPRAQNKGPPRQRRRESRPGRARDSSSGLTPAPQQRWQLLLAKGAPVLIVDTSQLVDGLLAGAVKLSAEVCMLGTDEWVPVWDVPEFADAIGRLPPASLDPSKPKRPQQQWYLKVPGGEPTEPADTEWILHQIRTGSVPLKAKVRPVTAGRWLPIWDVPEFAAAIQVLPPAAWRALQAAQASFDEAEAAREPTIAIRLYATAAQQFPDSLEGDEARSRACFRINARARGQVSTLLAEGRPQLARAFLIGIQDEMLAVGLDQSLRELAWRVSLAIADPLTVTGPFGLPR